MKRLGNLLSVEWLKTKRTGIRWLIFGFPAGSAALTALYLSWQNEISPGAVYQNFWAVWAAVILPVAAGLLTGFVLREEELAGDFGGLFKPGSRRGWLYFGKFASVLSALALSTALGALFMAAALGALVPGEPEAGRFLFSAALAVWGALPVLGIQLWISFAFGMGASAGVSILGLLAAVLMGTTSLGDLFWKWIPWTYPVKLSLYPAALLGTGEAAALQAKEQFGQFAQCVGASALTGALFLLLGICWFARWEGRKSPE